MCVYLIPFARTGNSPSERVRTLLLGLFFARSKNRREKSASKEVGNDKRGIFKHSKGLAFEYGTQKEAGPRYYRCNHALKYRVRTTNEAG